MLSDIFVPDSTLEDDWSLPGNQTSEESGDEDFAQVMQGDLGDN